MMKKKPKIVILMFAVIAVVIGSIVIVITGRKEQESTNTEADIKYLVSGSLGENLSEFVIQSETIEIGTELSDDYLKSINYTVLEVNEEKKTAVIEVEIPDILTELEKIVEDAIQQNPTLGYEELLPIVRENLRECMRAEKISTKTEQVEVVIENVENTYKLVPSAELEDALYKDLEDAYLEILLSGWEN
ncbi:MAG: hypothetical protein J6K04_13125 [Lachnospiraceae bacterium]|nr:hypothetical protein [Lachnospiraceae bacterium]